MFYYNIVSLLGSKAMSGKTLMSIFRVEDYLSYLDVMHLGYLGMKKYQTVFMFLSRNII